jgi:Fic family protein
MNQLSHSYRHACSETNIPILLTLATFIFDFLCIHPFRDGNGRVSRLLTTLLLEQHDFIVSRFISLEKLIEESKEDYYQVLHQCSQGWHEGNNDVVPWLSYLLSILRKAYLDFARQVESSSPLPAKTELVRSAIEQRLGDFTLADIKAEVPASSTQLIKKVMSQMKKTGHLTMVGRGRGALWKRK